MEEDEEERISLVAHWIADDLAVDYICAFQWAQLFFDGSKIWQAKNQGM